MIKVLEIQETSNPSVLRIVFQNVVTEEEQDEFTESLTEGPTMMLASKPGFIDKNKLVEGQQLANYIIEQRVHDTPQYKGHKPFDKNGKYYTAVIVNKKTGRVM